MLVVAVRLLDVVVGNYFECGLVVGWVVIFCSL
jgi:hypothetical protein